MERSSVDVISRHQKTLDAVYPDGPDGKFARERALFGVQAPPAPTQTGPSDAGGALQRARKAIADGAPREAVIERLRQGGIDPGGL